MDLEETKLTEKEENLLQPIKQKKLSDMSWKNPQSFCNPWRIMTEEHRIF